MSKSDFHSVYNLNLISRISHHWQMLLARNHHAYGIIGFRLIDRSQIFARYRHKFARSAKAFLLHGIALRNGFPQYIGQRKSSQTVVGLCRRGSSFDQDSSLALRQRIDAFGVKRADGGIGLRTGFDDNRFVFDPVQLGSISLCQSSCQASYAGRFEGIYFEVYSYQQRQNARYESTRPTLRARLHIGWRVLRHGQGICRFRSTLQIAHGERILRDPCQWQYASRLDSLVPSRRQYGIDERSVFAIDRHCVVPSIPRTSAMRNFYRSRNRQDLRVPDQQLHTICNHNLCLVQTAMAGRAVLQWDQTTSSNQGFLWQHGRCR